MTGSLLIRDARYTQTFAVSLPEVKRTWRHSGRGAGQVVRLVQGLAQTDRTVEAFRPPRRCGLPVRRRRGGREAAGDFYLGANRAQLRRAAELGDF
ncbi:hypothetical protein AQY21_24680 [Paracoccus sp. MKU1]|nr:hypothetical protein AQY21_24680 [Paracoccus sp. MKU1]